jgi:hypothetical protein
MELLGLILTRYPRAREPAMGWRIFGNCGVCTHKDFR